jgi:hypothetical protein
MDDKIRLYKFLPKQFVENLLDGKILFRNLVYFKKLEGNPRWDVFEGRHVDAPDHDVHVENISTGQKFKGPFAFHSAIATPEKVFCFCTSQHVSDEMKKYGAACVIITDAVEFERRLRLALIRRDRIAAIDKPMLIAGPVKYFDQTKAAPDGVDIKNARHLPFLKRSSYSTDAEYRFVFARRGGFALKEQFILDRREEDDDVTGLPSKEITLRAGSIRDIAKEL